MELQASSLVGAARVVLHVVTAGKAPVLEVYHQVRNQFGPELKCVTGSAPEIGGSIRHQEVFVDFTLVNVGSTRAEEVRLEFSGAFRRNRAGPNLPELELFHHQIPQMAPAQTVYLFRLDDDDLYEHAADGRATGIKRESFCITVSYYGANRGLNRMVRWWYKIRQKPQYIRRYEFVPYVVATDLPPPEYA